MTPNEYAKLAFTSPDPYNLDPALGDAFMSMTPADRKLVNATFDGYGFRDALESFKKDGSLPFVDKPTYESLKDYRPTGSYMIRKDASPSKPSPVLTAADIYDICAGEIERLKAELEKANEFY